LIIDPTAAVEPIGKKKGGEKRRSPLLQSDREGKKKGRISFAISRPPTSKRKNILPHKAYFFEQKREKKRKKGKLAVRSRKKKKRDKAADINPVKRKIKRALLYSPRGREKKGTNGFPVLTEHRTLKTVPLNIVGAVRIITVREEKKERGSISGQPPFFTAEEKEKERGKKKGSGKSPQG